MLGWKAEQPLKVEMGNLNKNNRIMCGWIKVSDQCSNLREIPAPGDTRDTESNGHTYIWLASNGSRKFSSRPRISATCAFSLSIRSSKTRERDA